MKGSNFTLATVVLLALSAPLTAQTAQSKSASTERVQTSQVIASASGNSARFSSLGEMIQLRLEVIGPSGEVLFDSSFKSGNVIDWSGSDTAGLPLADGTYLCVVSVKDSSGQIVRKRALASLHNQSLGLRQTENSLLSAAQSQTAGEDSSDDVALTILEPGPPTATAVIAHDGSQAQLVSGSGGLSISSGDFFANKVLEHMRLTAEGNVGIGISDPQAKLDVGGRIRASEGIVFPDGSVQLSAARKTLGAASLKSDQSKRVQGKDAALSPDISGTGTTGKIPKWLDGPNGVLDDSNITQVTGAIGINGAPDTRFRLDVNGSTRIRGSNPGFNLEGLSASGNIWVFQTVDDNGRFRLFGQDNINPGVERFNISLSTGNVGIGVTNPLSRLDVAGAINTTTDYRIGTNRVLAADVNSNTFVGVRAGLSGAGSNNSLVGAEAGLINSGSSNSFFGAFAGRNSTSASNNSFFGASAGRNNTGASNSFFGTSAGEDGTSGSDNSFFGVNTGRGNTTGSHNSYFGRLAGRFATNGRNNTMIGYTAGGADINHGGDNLTLIGAEADVSLDNLVNATAIGYQAQVSRSNSLVLGSISGVNSAVSSTRVAIGTTIPENPLHVVGAGTDSGGSPGFPNVVAHFRQTTTTESAAVSIDAPSGQSSILYLAKLGIPEWSIRNDPGDNDRFKIRRHHSDGTSDLHLTIEPTGNVGIGITNATNTLHVENLPLPAFGSAPPDHVVRIRNINENHPCPNDDCTKGPPGSYAYFPKVLALQLGDVHTPGRSNNFITFSNDDGNSVGSIQGNEMGGIELGGPGADYAEWLPRLKPAEEIQSGEIVGLHAGRVSKQTRGATQVMAVSTGAIVAGNDPGEKVRDGYELVAFIGQVMVRVRGKVQAGDFIVASGLNDGTGIAVAPECITSEQFEQTVGQAWESSSDEGLKSVRTAVGLIQRDPTVNRLLKSHQQQTAQIAALGARLTALESKFNKNLVTAKRTSSRSQRGADGSRAVAQVRSMTR